MGEQKKMRQTAVWRTFFCIMEVGNSEEIMILRRFCRKRTDRGGRGEAGTASIFLL